jgi:hypothetical protein
MDGAFTVQERNQFGIGEDSDLPVILWVIDILDGEAFVLPAMDANDCELERVEEVGPQTGGEA